jgi:hypothetical protein
MNETRHIGVADVRGNVLFVVSVAPFRVFCEVLEPSLCLEVVE